MKKQLLTAAIVVGLGSATPTLSGETRAMPSAEIAYKIVKKVKKGKEAGGAQAFFQGAGAAAGGLLGGVFGPIGVIFGAGLGAY